MGRENQDGLEQAEILSDSTPFDGSNIDAPISTAGGGADFADVLRAVRLGTNKPVPNVVDPLNKQDALSSAVATDANGDYELQQSLTSNLVFSNPRGTRGNQASAGVAFETTNPATTVRGRLDENTDGSTIDEVALRDEQGNDITTKSVSGLASGDFVELTGLSLNANTEYHFLIVNNSNNLTNSRGPDTPITNDVISINNGRLDGSDFTDAMAFDEFEATVGVNSGNVVDRFAAPTTAPADFQQWDSIKAQDVTTGGSTSANPIEFEILDSSDAVLNSTRIPKTRIADEPFKMRNRVYSESAGSDGQSDYQIATTGDGGHYGISVLTVVSVKQNGSVLDSANWSFNPDTDTATIDTSNVTIASGDTIVIKYDFDVFDSTLQPRAYLSRESSSETSPSISHFRYEYVI